MELNTNIGPLSGGFGKEPSQDEPLHAAGALKSAESLSLDKASPKGPVPDTPYLEPGQAGMVALAKTDASSNPHAATIAVACIKATVSGDDQMHVLKALCDRGFSLDTPDPITGLTPLGYAAKHANPECLATLLQLGASVDAKDTEGVTAWMRATEGMNSK